MPADATRVNAILNDPAVFPWIARQGQVLLDLAAAIPVYPVLLGDHGCILFQRHMAGLYEAHTSVLPAGRGPWAVWFRDACLAWIFTHTDAVEVMTKVPRGNLAARALTRSTPGGSEAFTVPGGWTYPNGRTVDVAVYGVRIQDWLRHAAGLKAAGEEFHRRLHERGLDIPVHEVDPEHDRHVGAAVAMIRGGQPDKGVTHYNRWAALAGAPRIGVVSRDPLVIDIRTARLRVIGDDFEVM